MTDTDVLALQHREVDLTTRLQAAREAIGAAIDALNDADPTTYHRAVVAVASNLTDALEAIA
jgi:hypothetical protein